MEGEPAVSRIFQRNHSNGQVIGLGIDIVDIPRFRETLEKRGKRFIDRIFLPSEQKYCGAKPNPWIHYAGRFAAKEAFAKAFGTGIGKELNWLDIEIICSDSKAPIVKLGPRAKRLVRRRRIKNVLVSISHTHAYTAAVALLVS
jgi:holo-[acyl-carrier protein] synthase